jgi:hypothetical protein
VHRIDDDRCYVHLQPVNVGSDGFDHDKDIDDVILMTSPMESRNLFFFQKYDMSDKLRENTAIDERSIALYLSI